MKNIEMEHPGIRLLRASPEREQMRRSSGLQDRALEEHLAVGEGRKQVLLAASAYLFEVLPAILIGVVQQALNGNLSASKLLLEIAGLKDSLQETVQANQSAESPSHIELEFLDRLRSRIASLPQVPDPLELG